MELSRNPGVVSLALQRAVAQQPRAAAPGAEGEPEHPTNVRAPGGEMEPEHPVGLRAPGGEMEPEHPTNVAAPANDGLWHRGQLHPLWAAPPATAINAQLTNLLDVVKGTFQKLRHSPDDLAKIQVQQAVQMMQADMARQQDQAGA